LAARRAIIGSITSSDCRFWNKICRF